MKKVGIFIVFLVFLKIALYSEAVEERSFKFEKKIVNLKTIVKGYHQTKIIFQNYYDITTEVEGENLAPQPFMHNGSIYVTFINYKNQKFSLYLYDHKKKKSKKIANFDFISSKTKIYFYDNDSYLIFFKAECKNNVDIYFYDSMNNKIVNVTETKENEKIFKISEEDGFLILKTETIKMKYLYTINPFTKEINLIKKERNIFIHNGRKTNNTNYYVYNNFLAFGDSITWGKMRMNNLEGEYHPELTFWYKAKEYFDKNYGTTYAVNLGIPGDSSYGGLKRMDQEFTENPAHYCYIMFGTNDVTDISFSAQSSAENIEAMALKAINDYNMQPFLFTIPPQRHFDPYIQYYKENTEALNRLIIKIGKTYNIPVIDTYKAFFEYSGSWTELLEDIKGNHPSPKGHQLIADLLIPEVLKLKPKKPENFRIEKESLEKYIVRFATNYEFDFSHYKILYGYLKNDYIKEFTVDSPFFYIYNFDLLNPFNKTIYLKISAVDKDKNESKSEELEIKIY